MGRGRLGAGPGGARSGGFEPGGLPEAAQIVSAIEKRLAELGIELPAVAAPVAAYVPAVLDGDRVWTSGQLPFVAGSLPATGKVGDGPGLVPPADAAGLARVAALNALA